MEQIKQSIEMLKSNKTGTMRLNSREILAVTPNAVVLRTTDDENRSAGNFEELILAVRINNAIIGNSSRMRTKERKDITQAIQRPMQDLIPMIPFEAMKQANLSIKEYRELDKGNETTVFIKVEMTLSLSEFMRVYANKKDAKIIKEYKAHQGDPYCMFEFKEPRHFTGARLFQVGSEVFLMDIDQNEIKHGIFNAFLVKLVDKTVKTIAEAYESLKPQAVKDALAQGLDVKRQGEWFFIPVDTVPFPQGKPERGALRAGNNRPNLVEEHILDHSGQGYVRGEIMHSGREHQPITLKTWHKALANTSITSWQLSGDID